MISQFVILSKEDEYMIIMGLLFLAMAIVFCYSFYKMGKENE